MAPDPSKLPIKEDIPSGINSYVDPIFVSDSDEEENEGTSYEGYQMLPQDVQDGMDEVDSGSEGDAEPNDLNAIAQPTVNSSFENGRLSEVAHLWNESQSEKVTDITMDSVKQQQVLTAMSGFSLPLSSIPTWAKDIPEEEWKNQLLDKIGHLQQKNQ